MLAGTLCPCAFTLDPTLDINQYAHKAWTVREGFFKGSIFAIAQMPDGYLWIGTDFGLVRFDGVRKLEWKPPNGEHLAGGRIRSLLAARDGRLWIGTDEGLATWKDGKLTAELAGHTGEDRLIECELDILELIGKGNASKDIAAQLPIREHTVKSHAGNILEKLERMTARTPSPSASSAE